MCSGSDNARPSLSGVTQEPLGKSRAAAGWSRWRVRRSTRKARWVLGFPYVGSYSACCVAVYAWAGNNGHVDWQSGARPLFVAVAAVTFWPLVLAHWRSAYPGDRRDAPWSRADDA